MKKKTVKAIVFADRRGEELLPLTETMCVALLPIAAKPLIEHTLDALSIARIRHVILIVSTTDAPQVKAVLGNGERLGVEIDYVLSLGQENPASLLANLNEKLDEPEYLLIRGDLLRSLKIHDFLEHAEQTSSTAHCIALVEGHFSGLCLWRKQISPDPWQWSEILHWQSQNFSHQKVLFPSYHSIVLEGHLSLLDSLASYYQANFDALANHFSTLTLPGYSVKKQLLVGRRSGKVPLLATGIIGNYCHINPKAALNQVIIGDRVIIDQQVELSHTIVFSDTYIGKSVKLQNAIIWGNCWIQLDSDTITLHIAHDLSLANLKQQSLRARIMNRIKRLLKRLPWVN
jgi:NDP-sugar pyrophosphorylase family protein